MSSEKNFQLENYQWRLQHVMADRGIRNGSVLREMLNEIGIEISTSQINRVINKRPDRIPAELFAGLMEVLQCDACHLLWDLRKGPPPLLENLGKEFPKPARVPARPKSTANGGKSTPARKRAPKREQDVPSDDYSVTGPKVTPIPKGDKKR